MSAFFCALILPQRIVAPFASNKLLIFCQKPRGALRIKVNLLPVFMAIRYAPLRFPTPSLPPGRLSLSIQGGLLALGLLSSKEDSFLFVIKTLFFNGNKIFNKRLFLKPNARDQALGGKGVLGGQSMKCSGVCNTPTAQASARFTRALKRLSKCALIWFKMESVAPVVKAENLFAFGAARPLPPNKAKRGLASL